jgi:hypothetical protein
MTVRTSLAVVALAAALVPAPAVRAQEDPFAKWQPRSRAQPSESRPSDAAGPADDQPPAVQILVLMGFDKGLTKAIPDVDLYDPSTGDTTTKSFYFNGGMAFSAGALFLPLSGGRLQTQATIGVQGWNLTAENGDIRWFAVPIEVMEFVNLGLLRVGAGLSYLINPKVTGKDFFAGPENQFDFKNSPGLVAEADFTGVNSLHPRKPRYWLGLRYRVHRLVDQYDVKHGGNSFGFVMGLAY